MNTNENGLTYDLWLNAAGIPDSKAARAAHARGEDPSDHRAEARQHITAKDIVRGAKSSRNRRKKVF